MKKHVRDIVWKCLHECPQVEQLIVELNKLIDKEGPSYCQAVLQLLAHIELPAQEAEKCWQEVLEHRQNLSITIGRSVSLQTAICDFFSSIQKDLKQPKVIELKVFEDVVRHSNYDYLTGLYNRATLDNVFAQEIARARRYHRELSLLFLDLDNFKNINDTFGHQVGDIVLQEVGAVLSIEKRLEDTAGRYGGEEFIVILPDTCKLDAYIFADRIRQRIEKLEIPHGGQIIKVTVSGGLASWPGDASEKATLIACADQALYKAKNEGKNLISLYGAEKRQFARIDFSKALDITILQPGESNKLTAMGKNLSLGGVLLESEREIAMGSQLKLHAHFGSSIPNLIFQGQVNRLERLEDKKYEIGVTFFQQNGTNTKALATYIVENLKTRGQTCSQTDHVLQAIMPQT